MKVHAIGAMNTYATHENGFIAGVCKIAIVEKLKMMPKTAPIFSYKQSFKQSF